MHAPCSGSGCAVHGFWSALDIAFGLLILIFLTRQRCEREQGSELKSREKPIGLVSLALPLGTGCVDGPRMTTEDFRFFTTSRPRLLKDGHHNNSGFNNNVYWNIGGKKENPYPYL